MIRPYKSEDLNTVMDIANRAWREIYAMFRKVYGEELFQLITPDANTAKGRQVKKQSERHPEWIFVCERNDSIVGFITFWLERDKKIGVIGNNAKDPDCSLRGVGQEMYAAVFDYFKREGMLYAKVGTGLDEAHAPARRAYEAAGFDIKHANITYYKKL